ncbi:unnamed protein product [Rotaria sp. Silwood2]|nr:unnamed protein product [Rotaria sp. Silwood2]CAF2991884.1 unnamed protein product [Rotaria sp. Silwood2]CAF3382554.1 unnamed protein product [Rotaria sp. Silwood2]
MVSDVYIQHDLTSDGLSNKNKCYATDMETSFDPTYLLPDYSKLSDSQFTQTLLTSTSTIINQDNLIEVLNKKDIPIFIRQLTQLLNKLNYSQLQHEQWSYYYNLGMTEDQYQLRLELDKRKKMLRLDAEEHRLIENFYALKPRQTERKSAKIIWKAIHEQQNIIDEIAIFKKWLEVHAQASSYTLQDVQLSKINHIFISLCFQGATSSTEHVAEQTIAKAEQMGQYYSKIINNEKNKLLSTRSYHKNIQQSDEIINIISQREHNMK